MTDRDDFLEQCRERYEGGDKAAIMSGLEHCLFHNTPIPHWLVFALNDAINKVKYLEVESWDDVLGRPIEKGKRLATARRNLEIAFDLYERVCERHKAGAAISKPLFEEVGAEFNISGTVASEIYYQVKKENS
jgi:hypothetical protein